MNCRKEVKLIAEALKNKSRRTMIYKNALLEQAKYFSPAYRDFVLKVINNKSLKIYQGSEGCIRTLSAKEVQSPIKLTRKATNRLITDIFRTDVLPHELGHAVDFHFGTDLALTSHVVLNDKGQTLNDIFTEEFNEKAEVIHDFIFNEYKNIINSNINDKAYDIFFNNIELYRKLSKTDINFKDKEVIIARRTMQKQLYKCGFVDVFYQIWEKNCPSILNEKYSPILDALSSKYDLSDLFLAHHNYYYYYHSENRCVQEFFANIFAAKVTSKHLKYDNLIELLPKSFNAFENLFAIIYDHIQNNKKFTDLTVR